MKKRPLFFLAAAIYVLFALYNAAMERRRIEAAVAQQLRAAGRGAAVDAALARTPPMGYNDWNVVHCNVGERLIEQTAKDMIASGLAAAGYRYVNIDDCWSASSRDSSGRLWADPKKFPHGLPALARYVHSLGLKLGIYADAGTATCQGYPGSYGYEIIDARTFASWGIDYLKEDWCHIPTGAFSFYTRDQAAEVLFSRMATALHATGRPIVLSMSGAGDPTIHLWQWGRRVADLWRTTTDIADSWTSILSILDQNVHHASAAGPGHWNDPDMLETGNGGMTTSEDRAHFTLWCMMAAPLIIGTDVRSMSRMTRAILTNGDLVAVDQDARGAQGTVIARQGNGEVLMKRLANGDRAVVLLNRGMPGMTISVDVARLGLKPARQYIARDLWTHKAYVGKGSISAFVPQKSVVAFRVAVDQAPGRSTP